MANVILTRQKQDTKIIYRVIIISYESMPKKMTEDGTRLKINKETEDLNNTIKQPDPNTEYTFFSGTYEISPQTSTNHMLDHKTNANIFRSFKSYKVCSLTTMK